jgi:hypothetical protein
MVSRPNANHSLQLVSWSGAIDVFFNPLGHTPSSFLILVYLIKLSTCQIQCRWSLQKESYASNYFKSWWQT